MKRKIAKKSSLSKASSYEAVGKFWDKHDLSDYWDKTRSAKVSMRLESKKSALSKKVDK